MIFSLQNAYCERTTDVEPLKAKRNFKYALICRSCHPASEEHVQDFTSSFLFIVF
ncbi:hypothetical protein BDW22DRAFT_1358301 [Trametopsis cervina]|nr:hypothetical protein BDW22DRAFT_1358301 [Trametopsis cervina]